MARPFQIYKGGLPALGQAETATRISPQDIEGELAARGYRMQSLAPGVPIPGIPAPGPGVEPGVPIPGRPAPGLEPGVPIPGIPEPGLEPGVPIPGIPAPGHLALHEPLLDLHVPYGPASPYAKYMRFLPYLVVLFKDRSVLDFGEIV